jgi:uroporphyrinogen-III decarboxylase
MVAVAKAVVDCQAADALSMSDYMAASYDASAPEHWYSPYNKLMLEGLSAGERLQYAATVLCYTALHFSLQTPCCAAIHVFLSAKPTAE